MQITKDNYFSNEASKEYMGVSLFKSFLPKYGGCEAKTMAKINDEWQEPDNPAFLLGSYVHAWNEGNLQEFISQNPALFKKNGELYAKYAIGDDMINTLKNDPVAMKALEGQKEIIMTGELFGFPWKIMIDSYNPKAGAFTDLKTSREINKTYWNEYTREKENFITHWGYDWQMAVYAEIERQNRDSDEYLNPHILAVSKETPPDKELIVFDEDMDSFVEDTLNLMESDVPRVFEVWKGNTEPRRCGVCKYCRETKKITMPVHYMEVGL